ncbi:5-hydroxyisourate hydrolase b isoform X2 [Betta splendens]|uniref:5-hydroxyisourate hydrolase n=1 Tax=Betta splendens TaxID=158456 RepID=A0A6P7MUR4_BETSP|nr:5-hydroxyisourate hydrolase b isoform X2 [Betta splendens]
MTFDTRSICIACWVSVPGQWVCAGMIQLVGLVWELNSQQQRSVHTQMMADSSPLTTHVLNTGDGVPAARMALSLHRLDSNLMIWSLLTVGTTNEDGRCPKIIERKDFIPGMYKLRFETGSYWESLGQTCFYPYVEVVFSIHDLEQKFHLPLLMSRFSYSTYRGS